MILTIDTADALSDVDKAVLRVLAGDAGSFPTDAQRAAAEESSGTTPSGGTAKKAAAKKAAPAKAAAPEPDPEPESPAAEPEGDDEEAEALRQAALAKASDLMSGGDRPKVLKALGEIGAPKVSEVPADRLQDFIDLLDA